MNPGDLENLIEGWRLVGTFATDALERSVAFERMRELIAQRTPETIARMEAAKGLR